MKTKLFVSILFIMSLVACSPEIIDMPNVKYNVYNTANNQTVVAPSLNMEVYVNLSLKIWANKVNVTQADVIIKEDNVVEAHIGDRLLLTCFIENAGDGKYTSKYSFPNGKTIESKDDSSHYLGEYVVPELQPGDYHITCSVNGVKQSIEVYYPGQAITLRVKP